MIEKGKSGKTWRNSAVALLSYYEQMIKRLSITWRYAKFPRYIIDNRLVCTGPPRNSIGGTLAQTFVKNFGLDYA
jgi:hypothetical protein